jgi:putative ABC transport system substrate-binding protein
VNGNIVNTSISSRCALHLVALALGLFASLTAWPQSTARAHRVALIFTTAPASEMAAPNPSHPNSRALLRALEALGYVPGRNLDYLTRSAEGHFDRIPDILRELVGAKVQVIVASDNETARRAKEIAPAVPVVVIFLGDPVESKLVASLAQPDGNITGLARTTGAEIEGKRLQLLHEAVPKARRIAFLGRAQDWNGPAGKAAQDAARRLGITLFLAEHSADDYGAAFAAIAKERPDALFVAESTPNFAQRKRIVDFAARNRLPSMFHAKEFVDAGGLMSYGADLPDLFRRAAAYVDKILKGARPAALPIERTEKFQFLVNLKTARALSLSIPSHVIAQADDIVQ